MSLYAPGSVMTPYYSEETVYSKSDLDLENEDGVSIIFYLQKIYPGSLFGFPSILMLQLFIIVLPISPLFYPDS